MHSVGSITVLPLTFVVGTSVWMDCRLYFTDRQAYVYIPLYTRTARCCM